MPNKEKGLLKSVSLKKFSFFAKARQGEARAANNVNFFTKVKRNDLFMPSLIKDMNMVCM
jgi:hypothetical protein